MIHYYHCYASGTKWRQIVTEHVDALISSGLSDELEMTYIGIVGPERAEAVSYFERINYRVCAYEEDGWEQVTLNKIEGEGPILYCHTKGAFSDNGGLSDSWRRSMTEGVVNRWKLCQDKLQSHDAVGCHWLSVELGLLAPTSFPFFGGNFWWANSDYLAKLPRPISMQSRYEAECWIGKARPRIYDLLPGWPGTSFLKGR